MFTNYYLIKHIIKDTDVQLDEELHIVRSGKILSVGASVPMELK